MAFAENLAALPAADHLARIELTAANGVMEVIENKPGSAGSVRVYAYLAGKHGEINKSAAAEGLAIYAEHTADARANPGKHPNIDRLFAVAASQGNYAVKTYSA